MKKIVSLLLCLLSCTCLLTSCKKKDNVIVVGTMLQPGAPILEYVKEKYEAKGYELQIKLYTDY